MIIHPQLLTGTWKQGFALDLHTTSSTPIRSIKSMKTLVDGVEKEVQVPGEITGWDTVRPEIAQELYRLKYWHEEWRVPHIAVPAAEFLEKYRAAWQLSVIIPIPPSDTTRTFQPVYKLAESIGNICNLEVNYDHLVKVKPTSQLKEIEDPEQRKALLEGAFDAASGSLTGRNILLFDDLYRSGETLRAAAQVLKNKSGVSNIYVLTITKTRSKR